MQLNLDEVRPQYQDARAVQLETTAKVEIRAAPGAFAGTAAVRCDVAAPAISGAKLLGNASENVTFTGRQL